MRKHFYTFALASAMAVFSLSSHADERILFDDGWKFALGDASDPAKDFGCGTEYFNYFTKAASIHNEGPYSPKFEESKWNRQWKEVNLPHDWVVDLPYDSLASHSHGYKTVGYKYPQTSVGWYRKNFSIPAEDKGKHISLRFDGIFRDAQVWVNGFYLGHEQSGYAPQDYDISEYLNYGGDNLVTVRVDASLEEGWFYEGAGIYRHVWLDKTDPLHVAPDGSFIHAELSPDLASASVTIETEVDNMDSSPADYQLRHSLFAPDGSKVASVTSDEKALGAKQRRLSVSTLSLDSPQLWDIENPQRYTLLTEVVKDGKVTDTNRVKTGFRRIKFDADSGFFLNDRHVKLKGMNMHQDHPGVGSAIPDALQTFRIKKLKELGANAYRASHNPMTPEMIDACDSLGMVVIEENRLTGINREHIDLLQRMIKRDRNHPSIILWSIGNEEWGTEWNEFGKRISQTMQDYCHNFDPTRPVTMASSSGPTVLEPLDVAGYNYIEQHPIDERRHEFPLRKAVGTEETSGRGTRGIYFEDHSNGHMVSINRKPLKHGNDSVINFIEHVWKFHYDRPWLAGPFYWTGFDYRGEPNPMKFPATGSQAGILDYCGFPKDHAYYLQSWWTDKPVLHILPHWNLAGHEGEKINVWAYSNCDEVELFVNGKSLGRKKMPFNGHLEWDAIYKSGSLKAVGYKGGKKVMEKKVETTGSPARLSLDADRKEIKADGRDVAVVSVSVSDKKGRFVPDACIPVEITVSGPVRILGVGNGDPAFQDAERPADPEARTFTVKTFNGLAQILLQSQAESGTAVLTISSQGIPEAVLNLETR